MSGTKKAIDYLQLAIAAARAAYGDFSGLVVQGVKNAPKIIAIACAIIIICVLLPVMFIQSIFIGDENSPSGTFSELALEALIYKEDWISVLAAAQTKKNISFTGIVDLSEAAQAVRNNSIERYLKNSPDTKDNVMDIYSKNLELLNNLLCSYAGYIYYYDEIPAPPSYESMNTIYNSSTGIHELETEIKVKIGTIKKDPGKRIFKDIDIYSTSTTIIYSSNDVVSYKVDGGRIKIKYKKFGLKAYFPITKEYNTSFSNDFGNARVHDGKSASHEGNDIFAERNTPIIAVEDCIIRKIGWNSFGGWRILLESKDGLRIYYYAHMENYVENLQRYKDISGKVYENPGIEVEAGEIVGYVGSSGSFSSNSSPGADTGTQPHLHFQLWVKTKGWFFEKETLLNPYYCLKLLENNRYSDEIKQNSEKLAKEGL
jgi:Membrane proteins related to metalloendopeptidases